MNGQEKKEYRVHIILTAIVAALIIMTLAVLVYVWLLPHEDRSFNNNEYAFELTDGWTWEDGQGNREQVKLNEPLPENIPDGVRIENTLPYTEDISFNTIAIYSHYQKLRIYLDDELYADSTDPYGTEKGIAADDGNYWYLVRLPEDSTGKKIAIEVQSFFKNHRYVEQTIYIGSKWSIIAAIFRDGALYMAGAALMILFGIFFLIFYFITIKWGQIMTSTAFLSGTLFWIGVWIMDQCGLMQFITGNARLVSYLGFAPICMGTVFAMLYLMSIMKERFQTLNRCILLAMTGCWAVETVLQLTGVVHYYLSIRAYHLVIGVFVAAMLGETFWAGYIRKVRDMRLTFFILLLLVGFTGVQLVVFYKNDGNGYNDASALVLFLLIIIVMVQEMIRASHMVSLANMSAIYKKTSVTDDMTGLANERGMNEWIDTHEGSFGDQPTAAFVFDLNKLKKLNDQLGHRIGDQGIIAAADVIHDVFAPYGMVARTGGDEFTAIVLLKNMEEADKLQEKFLNQVQKKAKDLPFPFSVSVGYAFYEEGKSVGDMIMQADMAMYRMKKATGMERRD
ncbi:MAG: GGDEF domain-containing protein [Eubacterium sp.]|nr:GGDEF domain-containing protein [Eubacterium sp.]